MSTSPLPTSRPVTPDLQGALIEHGSFVHQLVGFAHQMASHHQGLVSQFERQQDAHNSLLTSKNADIERIVDNEAVVRNMYEKQIAAEQQQWSSERGSLQKALQEQQGTAFTLQTSLQARISELEEQLQVQEADHASVIKAQHSNVARLQETIDDLQQRQQQLLQDLKQALAYRQKCVVQKQKIEQLEKQIASNQHGTSPETAVIVDDAPIDLTRDAPEPAKHASTNILESEVQELRRSREVLKQAYHKEKTKADRYRTAYKNLRDFKQPSQPGNRNRAAAVATSMPHMPHSNARLSTNAADLASEGAPAAARPKPPKAKPSKQHCFTAEMDLAAAGFLQPNPSALAVAGRLSADHALPVSCDQLRTDEAQLSGRCRNSADQLQVQSRNSQQLQSCSRQKLSPRPGSHRTAHCHRQTDSGCSSEDLSPGAKELLRITGLMSEEQNPAQDQQPSQAVLQDTVQAAVLVDPAMQQLQSCGHAQQQPQQDVLVHPADAVQQLDQDSVCRLSDPCYQPAKRSKSCLPDSCHADGTQASGSQTLSDAEAQQVAAAGVDFDEVESVDQSGLLQPEPSMLGLQTCDVEEEQQQHQHQRPVTLGMGVAIYEHVIAEPAKLTVVPSPRSPQAHAVPMQYDSLDITQPNLTPAPQSAPGMRPVPACTRHNENTAPKATLPHGVRNIGFGGFAHPDAGINPDSAQPAGCFAQQQKAHCDDSNAQLPAAASYAAQNSAPVAQQRRLHRSDSYSSGAQQAAAAVQPKMGKSNSGKWRQRAGQRDAAFAGDDELHVITAAPLLEQPEGLNAGGLLRQEAGCAATLPEDAAQPRNGNGSFKYQEVVRKKAEREALQGIQCLDCKYFYEAVETWGDHAPLPVCGHVLQGLSTGNSHQQAAATTVNPRQQLHQDASRHRYRHAPPGTPNGFWDMGFADSLDSRM